MADKTGIEWTDATWNPTTGCDKVSPGCDNCYAMTLAPRLKAMGSTRYQNDGDPKTSGPGFGFTMHPDALDQPLKWTRPRLIFVNSMSDLFHSDMTPEFLAQTPRWAETLVESGRWPSDLDPEVPLPNVWLVRRSPSRRTLGTSVEDQKRADLRVRPLLDTPAAVRFLSCEPLLGPVDLINGLGDGWLTGLDWIIVGGESGRGARPMRADWARSLRDQCGVAGVAFHFKQWGSHDEHGTPMHKKVAGRVLDGRTWDEFPQAVA